MLKLQIVFFILFSKICSGQAEMFVPISHFSEIDNHPIANVKAILQDKYGFLWLGTQNGLLRYDGKRAVSYSKTEVDKRREILNNDIDFVVAEPNSDFIWVLSSYGGIVKINLVTGSVIEKIVFRIPGQEGKNFSYHGIEFLNGKFYIATEDSYILILDCHSSEYTFMNLPLSGFGQKIVDFCSIEGSFLVYTNAGYFLSFEPDFKKVISSLKTDVYSLVKHANIDGSVYFGTDKGVKKLTLINKGLSVKDFGTKEEKDGSAFSIAAHQNSLYVGYANGLVKYSDSEAIQIASSKGKSENKWLSLITSVGFVNDQILVGSEFGLAIIKQNNPFTPFFQDRKTDAKLEHCFGIYWPGGSSVNIAAADGCYDLNISTGNLYKYPKDDYFISCYQGIEGENVFSGLKGTVFAKNGKLIPISKKYPLLAALDNQTLVSSCRYKDSLFFFPCYNGNGIYIYNAFTKKLTNINLHSSPLKLSENRIAKLFIDGDRLWILYDNLIETYEFLNYRIQKHVLINPETKEPLNIIKDICRIGDKYFIAVYGMGVVSINSKFEVEKIYAVKEGITNVNLYSINSVGDSLLLSSSNDGLFTINIRSGKVRGYFEEDGLHSNSFEQFSAFYSDQKLIFGGIGGITIVDPAKFKENLEKPLVYFSSVHINLTAGTIDTSNILSKKIIIPANVLQTNINLSFINFSNPKKTVFVYRITEHSMDWISNGTDHNIQLIGLAHGTYHLQVKAANEDGVWSEPKELVLVYLPKWYQTWWFKLLIILFTAGVIYAFYRYRISQIKKQHEIRKNIATDLHDDLGSTLNSVKVFTNLAISGVKQEESLQQVKDNLTEATMSLRDMIWVLDDSLDTVDELTTRLKQFAIPVAAASNIEATVKADSIVNSRQLTKEDKRNLFLICKEAINNSIKYSGATQIDVSITASGKKIQIVVADNGTGFNVDEVKRGYGLKNMQYRAEQIKYKAILASSPGAGTQIKILPS